MIKMVLVYVLSLLCITNVLAQNEYYTMDGQNRLNKSEVEAFKLSLQEKTTRSFGTSTIVDIVEEERYYKEDSIIVKVKFDIKEQDDNLKNEPVLSKGVALPTFNLKNLEGEVVSLDTFLGKPTLLNFWFTGCAPCIEEMPILNKIANNFDDKVNFVSITFEPGDRVERFLTRRNFDFVHLVDANDYMKELGIEAFPKHILIDSKGAVISIREGIPDKSSTNRSIDSEEDITLEELLNLVLQQN